jgi:2-aminoethylphosphonate transport system ATP-binding protein
LYRAPKSEFTASFVGSANLLPVTVGERGVFFGERRVEVRGVVSGGEATLCVRPHLVGLGEGPNQLAGVVREIQWRGATHRLYVDVDGRRVMADVPELKKPPVHGDAVTLHFAPEDAVLLSAGVGDE